VDRWTGGQVDGWTADRREVRGQRSDVRSLISDIHSLVSLSGPLVHHVTGADVHPSGHRVAKPASSRFTYREPRIGHSIAEHAGHQPPFPSPSPSRSPCSSFRSSPTPVPSRHRSLQREVTAAHRQQPSRTRGWPPVQPIGLVPRSSGRGLTTTIPRAEPSIIEVACARRRVRGESRVFTRRRHASRALRIANASPRIVFRSQRTDAIRHRASARSQQIEARLHRIEVRLHRIEVRGHRIEVRRHRIEVRRHRIEVRRHRIELRQQRIEV
jgi:hypothetical protein